MEVPQLNEAHHSPALFNMAVASRGKKHPLDAHQQQHGAEHHGLGEEGGSGGEEKLPLPRAKKLKLTEEQKEFVRRLYNYNREEYMKTLRKEKINFRNYVARTAKQLGITKGAVQRSCAGEIDPTSALPRARRGGSRGKSKLDINDENLSRKVRKVIRRRTRRQLPTTIKDIADFINGHEAHQDPDDPEDPLEDQMPPVDSDGQKYSVSNETVRRYLVKLGLKFQRGKGIIVMP